MTDGPEFTFLTVDDVLSLHEVAIDTWGGTHGIRDRGLLESAVGAATNIALYDEAANIYDVAAAYAYHVAQNQPFLDGNKRTGVAAAAAFLFVNGIAQGERLRLERRADGGAPAPDHGHEWQAPERGCSVETRESG